MTAKIYIHSQMGRTVYVTMSPNGDEVNTFGFLSVAELFCAMEYGNWEVETW